MDREERAREEASGEEQAEGDESVSGAATPLERVDIAFAKAGAVEVAALFSGQGNDCLKELGEIFGTCGSQTRRFIAELCVALEEEAMREENNSWYVARYGLNVRSWIDASSSSLSTSASVSAIASAGGAPPEAYLRAAPVSYPLIFVTQVVVYLETLTRLNLTHEEAIRSGWLKSATGHSQGIMAATLLSLTSTREELEQLAKPFAKLMLAIGLQAHQVLDFELAQKKTKNASPMISIRGLTREELERLMQVTVRKLRALLELQPGYDQRPHLVEEHTEMHIALRNRGHEFVVSGHTKALVALQEAVSRLITDPSAEQTRVPFSKRKASGMAMFLQVTAPFHCRMNQPTVPYVLQDAERLGLADLSCDHFQFPVYSTFDGSNLQTAENAAPLIEMLVRLQLTEENNFLATVASLKPENLTHIVSFGPGRALAKMAHHCKVGSGILVVDAAFPLPLEDMPAETNTQKVVRLTQILAQPNVVLLGRSWKHDFSPRITVRASDSKKFLETRFTRMVGRPPVIMSGMTPTTSLLGIDLVAACSNAGFQGELAAGGLPTASVFRSKIEELVSKLEPGAGININMLYLNARQWGFQFPLVLELANEGFPIESITIGAGVPSPSKAEEIFEGLRSAKISLIGFKPGSVGAIRDVLELAKLDRGMKVMLQWTSGRGGGHHSFEDFHEPLLATYSEIRLHENVILVVGSGFGDAQGSFEYLDGTWSTKPPYNRAAHMPVDAVLFGSRCMVAKEAATSPEIKQLIVNAPGIENEKSWDTSYEKDTGGIITVQSELGEPIHKVNTRGIKFWKTMDEKYFSLERGPKRAAAIAADKEKIIHALNADFQKLYFGISQKRSPVDLSEMTYFEVISRMIELMYVRNGGDKAGRLAANRWIDPSYQTRTLAMIRRTQGRFSFESEDREHGTVDEASFVQLKALDKDPQVCVDAFAKRYPSCKTTLLASQDVDFFVDLCKDLRNGKPVNFVPVIDEDLAFWVKKDSLWYSEQIDAVPERDPGRVCILHGPVAARFSVKVDEPIAEILGNIHKGYLEMLSSSSAHEDSESENGNNFVTVLGPRELQTSDWSDIVCQADRLVHGKMWVPNPIAMLCKDPTITVRVVTNECAVKLVHRYTEATLATVQYSSQERKVTLKVRDPECDNELIQTFTYCPENQLVPLLQSDAAHEEIKSMYRKVWDCHHKISLADTFSDSMVLSSEEIEAFNKAIGSSASGGSIDIATMAGWRPLVRALFAEDLQGNLLKLVHLNHQYKLTPKQQLRTLVQAGEKVDSEARVTSVEIVPKVGKKIKVEGKLWRWNQEKKYEWLSLASEFLIRGDFYDYTSTFKRTTKRWTMTCQAPAHAATLKAMPWLETSSTIETGDVLTIRLSKVEEQGTTATSIKNIVVEGTVLRQHRQNESGSGSDSDGYVDLSRGGRAGLFQIGTISYASGPDEEFSTNPIVEYFERNQNTNVNGTIFESGGYELLEEPHLISAPSESLSYALASHDLNPIHRNKYLATIAELPMGSTIVHGMWTAAMARGVLESSVTESSAQIASYQVDFVDMVFPEDQLCVTLQHVGVIGGRKIITIKVHKVESRALVMKGRAEVEQHRTAYLFTGQGSASVGMGMDRYEEVECVRKVWDTADAHLKFMYGFSLLQIVRENPKSLTVHFGGPQGKRIRDNYRRIRSEDPRTGKQSPVMKEIRSNTKSFTFHSPQGLLFATQFSQPALVIVQKAAFQELVEGGYIPDDAVFAGHSLGEYAALASFADVLSIPDLVETVFMRGVLMQNAVERDATGHSNYGMVAANPSRVRQTFTADHLAKAVTALDKYMGALLQIVNYNVRGNQYVVAGELVALDALGELLKLLAGKENTTLEDGEELEALMDQATSIAKANWDACKQAKMPYVLRRGLATIPLPGIDVPFHSRQLLGGVQAFRELLEPRLHTQNLGRIYGRLVGKYIPNVVAESFSLGRKFVETVQKETESPLLAKLLKSGYDEMDTAEKVRTLLVELLAYQFAMPVRWIETQDVIFGSQVQRVIEMGPAATLTTMARRSVASRLYGDKDDYDPEILWYQKDADTVFYQLEDQGPSFNSFADALLPDGESEEGDATMLEVASLPKPFTQTMASSAPVIPHNVSAPTASDAPVAAKHILRVMMASKFNKSIREIDDKVTIKDLSNGKSAIQNEVVGDLGAEFGSGPESAAEMPLKELTGLYPGYKSLGKVTTKAVSKLLSGTLPGGFSQSAAKDYLRSGGLGPGRVDSVLVHALTMAPGKRLGSVEEAKQWLDTVRDDYASDAGVNLTPSAPGGGSDMMMSMQMGAPQSAPVQPVPDAPVAAKHVLQVMLASKFDKEVSMIAETATVKQLSNGKSAIQNEIVGDLNAEFGGGPEGAEDVSIKDLAAQFASYKSLGKVTSKSIAKLLGAKLPGGFGASTAKQYLATERHLGPGRIDSVLVHALSMPPSERIADVPAAQVWLDKVTDSYGSYAGLVIPKGMGSAPSTGGGMMMSSMRSSGMSPEQLAKLVRLVESQMDAFRTYLDISPQESSLAMENETAAKVKAESYMDSVHAELGESFCESVQPQHEPHKVRIYDSSWNWVLQDALDMHCTVLAAMARARGEEKCSTKESRNPHFAAMANWITAAAGSAEKNQPPQAWFRNYLCNRATPELLEAVFYFSHCMEQIGQHEYAQVITLLAEQVRIWIHRVPVHVALLDSQAPRVRVNQETGSIEYFEEPRPETSNAIEYVKEMSRGLLYVKNSKLEVAHPSQSVQLSADGAFYASEDDDDDKEVDEREELAQVAAAAGLPMPLSETELHGSSGTSVLPQGPILEGLRKTFESETESGNACFQKETVRAEYSTIHVTKQAPLVHLKVASSVDRTVRVIDESLSSKYLSSLDDIAVNGVSFAGQVALVTGAGKGSISEELIKNLLEGGATVICTLRTSRSQAAMTQEFDRFRNIYEEFGAKQSKLILEPANCASAQDMASLVKHIYEALELDIDYVIPFAAAPERGMDITSIGPMNESAHRMMLSNVLRLLGHVKVAKETRNIETRPAMVLLPMSPNHGEFGQDGLYAESKLGVEALLNKWGSEGWGDYLCLAGAVIGWTRSKLMAQNNVVAEGIEALGCRTFSTAEMAFNLIGLLHPKMVTLASEKPLWADLTGNWISVPDIKAASDQIRTSLQKKAKVAQTVHKELGQFQSTPTKSHSKSSYTTEKVFPLASPCAMGPNFPHLPSHKPELDLEGMVDLRQVVVVAGFGEIGPWGNATTRWEIEAEGEFSLEGAILLAWMVGLIKPHNGPLPGKQQRYIGWVDAETNDPVPDHEIKRRYEAALLDHCGIRIIEPELFEGYTPSKKTFLHRVALDRDMSPFEVDSEEEAQQYRNEIGDEYVYIFKSSEKWMVQLKRGAVIAVPKAAHFDRNVAGQIPTGWDPIRMGVPEDIAKSVDPASLYTLVCTMEALVSAGLSDPYELYEHVHVSEVGNALGGGMGGMRSLKRMFFDRKLDDDIPADTLAESFINTTPAYINMLLLSSSGPIKTPVGACATAAESLDIAVETIKSGKARVMIAGGFDDFGETGSYEFAQMKATCSTDEEVLKGRTPREASRPMTDSRAGFVEAHGAGVQVLMDAELALKLGCPIYTVLGLTTTATDKQGRSVPAPGMGLLTSAREKQQGEPSPMLDISFRRSNLHAELEAIKTWEQAQPQSDFIASLAARKRSSAYKTWGQDFFHQDPTIAPIRGALAVWGLGIDDLGVASFHGTSTKLNDSNESHVIQSQLAHLGRTKGNVLPVVCQKYLTAHPKGAAAAWIVNGLTQVLLTGKVPGNRNLDNVSGELRQNKYLLYPNRTIQLPEVKAAITSSFGFGQAGAQVILIHSNRLLGALNQAQFAEYQVKRKLREQRAFRYIQDVLTGKCGLVQVKTAPPYSPLMEEQVYLNPAARATFDLSKGTWQFKDDTLLPKHLTISPKGSGDAERNELRPSGLGQGKAAPPPVSAQTRLQVTLEENALNLRGNGSSSRGVGIDVEPITTFEDPSDEFLTKNFTRAEQEYCELSSSPASSFGGRWAAKEAVIKAISSAATDTRSLWSGAAAPLCDIEVLPSASGAPQVTLHGHVKQVFEALGLSSIKVSISHSSGVAVAQAVAE